MSDIIVMSREEFQQGLSDLKEQVTSVVSEYQKQIEELKEQSQKAKLESLQCLGRKEICALLGIAQKSFDNNINYFIEAGAFKMFGKKGHWKMHAKDVAQLLENSKTQFLD